MASSQGARFRYGLQALLRKRCAELDLAREELAGANERLESQTLALEARVAQVAQLETYQRALSRGGASIDVEERMRLHDCLRSAVLQKEQQAVQLEQARQQRESALAQVQAARQALKAIERHREQSQEQFNVEQLRKGLLTTDELHLSSLRSTAVAGLSGRALTIVTNKTPSGSAKISSGTRR
jgi:hypothetical protein